MSRNLVRFVIATTLAVGTASAFAKNTLNDTGMLKCLDSSGTLTNNCANTGQDGEFGRDVTTASPGDGKAGFAFVRVCNSGEMAGQGNCPGQPIFGALPDQWGCTLDKVTGLLWELKTADGGPRDHTKVYTNYGDKRAGDASRYPKGVNRAGLCGRTNWRFPAPAELLSIVDQGVIWPAPMIDSNWFPNTSANSVWTGADQVGIPEQAWDVGFASGSVGTAQRYFQLGVRLVSKAAGITAGRFTAIGDEVTDNLTGLIWRRCGEGQTWDGTACAGDLTAFYAWHSALAHAKATAQSTGVGWRMPNAKEQFSIVDVARSMPAIDPVFPNTSSDYCYWTSTSESSQPDDAMPMFVRCVAFNEGRLSAAGFEDDGSNPRWMRLVRNAR